jgi:4a-hydroxytetrahydrobiopterin dehydratase
MATLLKKTDVQKHLKALTDWTLKGGQISRQYKFSDFVAAMAFVNHVAVEAEKLDHHPDILIKYNRVKLTLSTHSAGGLTELDFKLARKIDG